MSIISSKFPPKLSDVSALLRKLTTDQFKFTGANQHDGAFTPIQQLIIKFPLLKFYNIGVTIQTDASDRGLSAVLLQGGQPVPFAIRILSLTEQRSEVIEKKCW